MAQRQLGAEELVQKLLGDDDDRERNHLLFELGARLYSEPQLLKSPALQENQEIVADAKEHFKRVEVSYSQ